MTDKKINEEQLEKVSGGKYPGNAYEEFLQYRFDGYVDRYNVQAGHTYYFAMLCGTLNVVKGHVTWTGEVSYMFGSTVRTHKINILRDDTGYFGNTSTGEVKSGPWVAYTVCNGERAE